ncbi:acidic mammalian chitinase-like [Mytilus californianus]|uniref:acidic mammalian chitinase-like n=1 Tax=Mytilus californianus TaxID=6549 RepID=UPI002248712F|nr:acidic mammalian chitinase-like [Mytilus californianus]
MFIPRLLLVLVSLSYDIAESTEYKRVCYYTNWSQYRLGNGKFLPSDIDPYLCTHIIYAFGKLNGNLVQKLEYNDYELYSQLNDLKRQNPSLKTLLALGGWTAGSVVYSQMVSTQGSRAEFISSAIQYLRKYNFDGLDIDWEYPANRGGQPQDKVNFGLLVKELKEAFDAESQTSGLVCLLLTAAVAAGKYTVDTAYDIPTMAQYMDFINIMSYDLHGSWQSTTGHNSPLFPKSNEYGDQRYLNIDYVAKYWNSSGTPKEKLIIGLATYGRTFTLSGSQTGIGAAANGPGIKGQYTRETGFMSYYEICTLQESGKGRTVYDSEQMVPYYTDGSLWVGFDDEVSLAIKIEWLVSEGYGGAMVWALPLDDFRQTCSKSSRKYPLLNTIKDGLIIAENGGTLTTPALPTGMFSEVPTTSGPTKQGESSSTTQEGSGSTTHGGTSSGFSCSDKIRGIYPDPDDCSKFYNCEGGVAFHMNCPTNLLYNSNRKYCDYPTNVVCMVPPDVSTKATSTFPPSLSSVSSVVTSSSSTSTISSDSTTLSSLSSTSSIQNSASSSSFAPSSSILSTQSSTVTSTSKSLSSSQNPTSSSMIPGTSTATMDISPTAFCVSKSLGFYPVPTDCSKYYRCYPGGAVQGSCQQGLYWNTNINICDWPRNVDCSRQTVTSAKSTMSTTQGPSSTSTLKSSTRTTTTKPATSIIMSSITTTTLTSTTQSISVPLTSVNTPVTTSSTSTITTPKSTSTSESSSIVPTQTTMHTSATSQPLVTTTSSKTVPSNFCAGKASGNYPHPGDCSKYISCVGNTKYIQNCPQSLWWNTGDGYCDWKHNVDCDE